MTAHQDTLHPDLGTMPVPESAIEVGIADHLVVVAHGAPAGQGNLTRSATGHLYSSNPKVLKPWRDTLITAAREAIEEMHPDAGRPLFRRDVPVRVGAVWTFSRSGGHYGTGRNAGALKASAPREHVSSPDIDKLLRAVLDAFTAAGVWHDDRQVTRLGPTARVYPGGHTDALAIPGVVIRIRAVAP